jgi:acyl-CoA reductase-like NAD-dependent aldehyde dehydrogenase
VVHSDADIELAAKAACRGGYAHAGQICISVQRVYVQERIYEKFLSQFSSLVGALTVGDPLDEKTDVGPMIDSGSVEKTCQWVQDAVKAGAKLVYGGQQKGNNLLTPVILADTTSDMSVVCQEVFGPVVSVMKYDTIDDALALTNIDVAFKLARGIDAGGVIVNDTPSFRADHMPYGGRKESGLGLEGVRYALMEMTQPKFICLNLNNQVQ